MPKENSAFGSDHVCKETDTNELVSEAFGHNITEDILEKWIIESDINKNGKVNYSSFLHKMKQQKKKKN